MKVIFLFVHAFRIYEEIQKIEANEFHYQEQVRIQTSCAAVFEDGWTNSYLVKGFSLPVTMISSLSE